MDGRLHQQGRTEGGRRGPGQDRELRRALRAVYFAIAALRHAPRSPRVSQAISEASSAVATLPAGFVAEALYRLIGTIEDCHRAGTVGSTRLDERWRTATAAVRLAG
ncbi:hypothetical protein ACL02T_24605 [Pseudonocardia sp. RS010]|uniref:hypothetical protein n=1 Tax=Pseudonocardia sp. RS010 TaxID=3385979 RepID=UPI00399F2C62